MQRSMGAFPHDQEIPGRWRDSTRAIHAGESKHGIGGPVVTPIVRSSTFSFFQ